MTKGSFNATRTSSREVAAYVADDTTGIGGHGGGGYGGGRCRRHLLLGSVLMAAIVVATVVFLLLVTGVIETKRHVNDEARACNNGGCQKDNYKSASKITKELFGYTSFREEVYRYTIVNKNGMVLQVIDLGGIITTIKVPDKNAKFDDVTLGFDDLKGYIRAQSTDKNPYFGALIGRFANRIALGRFQIDGRRYQVSVNNGNNTLHGGKFGFDKALWKSSIDENKGHVIFHHVSSDGDMGFPGQVTVRVTYELTDDNQVVIQYNANTTKATPINLTSHSYFNLAGGTSGTTIYDHNITIYADKYTPVTLPALIPTGEIASVDGTVFDLRRSTSLRSVGQVPGGGYDHNFVLRGPTGRKLAARLEHEPSGRVLEVFTDQPGMQFYTGNFLNNITGKGGVHYPRHGSVSMETQNFPNAVNQPNFPDCILRPGYIYEQTVWYAFSVM